MKDIIEKINNKRVNKSEWIILCILLCFPFFTECFYDLLATYAHGFAFLKAICKFDFLNGYDYANDFIWANGFDDTLKSMKAAYPVTIYVIFAFWSIPIAVIRKLFATDIFSPGIILWYKFLLVIFSAGALLKLKNILELAGISKERISFLSYVFATSLFFVLPTLVMAQYDIFTVFFMLWGIEAFLKGSNKIKWMLLFGIAITFKSFALLVFIPMVLLTEKRILRCISKLALGLLPSVTCSGLFAFNDTYMDTTKSFYPGFISRLFGSALPGNSPIVLFFGCTMALCIWAYIKSPGEQYEVIIRYVAWIGLVAFSVLLTFVYCHPQWCILIIPFIVITIGTNEWSLRINFLLETIAGAFLSFYYTLHFWWVYWTNTSMRFTFMKGRAISNSTFGNMADAYHAYVSPEMDSVIFTGFVVAVVALIIINYPERCKTKTNDNGFLAKEDYGVVLLRIGAIIGFWVIDLLINLGSIL